MAAPENLTKAENIKLQAKEIDFISRFQDTWEALREILGIMRPIRKQPGTKLVASTATVTLQDGNVAEGDVVPYSQAEVTPVVYEDLTIEKFRKGVSIEAVSQFGAAVAVQKTDDAFLKELQGVVLDRFYDFLQTGTLTDTENSFQMAVSMAVTLVKDKFKTMRKDYTNIVCFVNTMDVGLYQGSATITIQNREGIEYAKDFMGANTMIISSEIPQGTVIAIPADNIVLYYIDPSDADITELGLFYTTWGETSLIGVNKTGNYERVIGDTNVIMGMKLFAEYLDGISVVTISDNTTLGTLTVDSAAGTESGTTKLTVTPSLETGHMYKYKTAADAAPAVTYGQNVRTWTAWDGKSDITATTGHHITVVECDNTYKALKSGTDTIAAQT